MSHETEAACLLRTGRLYSRRGGWSPLDSPDTLVFAGVKHGAFSLYYDDEPFYHLDLEGRWQRAFLGGIHYLRSLDGTVDALDRVREGANLILHRSAPTPGEVAALDERIREDLARLRADVRRGAMQVAAPPEGQAALAADDLDELLARVEPWDQARWEEEARRFRAVYGPIGFLPPDARQSVVLQASTGTMRPSVFDDNPVQPPHPSDLASFATHARGVRALLGRRLAQSRRVYLAGDDLAFRPLEEMLGILAIAGEVFPLGGKLPARLSDAAPETIALAGIDMLVHDADLPWPDRAGWTSLRERHLRRVYLVVESGDPAVRRNLGRTWTEGQLATLVGDLRASGIELQLLVPVDAGGAAHAEGHLDHTVRMLSALELGRGDVIYLLDGSMALGPEWIAAGHVLTGPPLETARGAIQQRLGAALRERGVKVVPYNILKQGV